MAVAQAAPSRILAELQSARQQGDHLFALLKPDALYDRPISERHRVIFYIGHLDGFDSIQICREGLGLKSPDPELDALFQAGIDPDSSHLPTDKATDWPSLELVRKYVGRCRARVDEYLDEAPADVVEMALEHRLMHFETLAYMFHNFPYEKKVRRSTELGSYGSRAEHANPWREIPAGSTILGKAEDGTFGWDNEYQEMHRHVGAFRIQQFNVTNGEYLAFVEDGAKLPHFWARRGKEIQLRCMLEEIPLPLDWPVYVSQAEAEAYAKWSGAILPSEEQFHRAAYGSPGGELRAYPWGNAEPSQEHGNFNFRRWDPEPVYATAKGESAFGVNQLVGNGWEWTRTPFEPFTGFQPRSAYPGYSANFFDGDHFVLKGGSARTASRLLRRSFRNWFRRDYPYMYATFRCVQE
jgi:iron(II)-dependent oxidoreductase